MVGSLAGRVVVAVREIGVVHDRRARHGAEGDVLRGQTRRRAHDDAVLELVRMIERPLQHLHAAEGATHGGQDARDAQVREQLAVHLHKIGDGKQREAQAVRGTGCGIDRRRAGRSLAATEQVRRDHEEAVGVDRLAGADQRVPPARPVGIAMVAGGVRIAREGMADHDDVAVVGCALPVGLVRHLDGKEGLSRVEYERVVLREEDDPLRLDESEGAPRVVGRSHRTTCSVPVPGRYRR